MNATIALIGSNSLMMIGLKSLLEKIIPFADIAIYNNVGEMHSSNLTGFAFHYFITPSALIEDLIFFRQNRNKVIVLSGGEAGQGVPSEFRSLNIRQSPKDLLKQLLFFQHHAHHGYTRYPNELAQQIQQHDQQGEVTLSTRETEVLTLLAKGLINKEIADSLSISINTVITHRKNIMQKLNSQSLSKLVVYAVQHNLITVEEIK